jgi:hypothetical protein
MCLDNVTLPAWPGTRNRLGLRHHGLILVHLEKCLFLLSLPFLCVAYSCAVVDKKDHTAGAIHVHCTVRRLIVTNTENKELLSSGELSVGLEAFLSLMVLHGEEKFIGRVAFFIIKHLGPYPDSQG